MITIVIDQQGHFILTELKSLFFVFVVENSLHSDISAFFKFPKGIFSAMFIQLSWGSQFFLESMEKGQEPCFQDTFFLAHFLAHDF